MSPPKKSSENKSYLKNEAERKRAQREKVKLLYPARARSISRAEKALPKSPRKKAEVLSSLARKYQLPILMNKKRGLKAKELTGE